jgi:hypothetical protein
MRGLKTRIQILIRTTPPQAEQDEELQLASPAPLIKTSQYLEV